MAEALPSIVIGLALTLAIALTPATAQAQAIRSGPTWTELSAQERQVLAPLAPDWDKLDLLRKNKWLAMSKRYQTLPGDEQQRIQERMQGWAKLSSQERQAAREKFKGLKQLPPEQRKELPNKWMEYQSLPQEEQQALRRAGSGQRNASGPATDPRPGPSTSTTRPQVPTLPPAPAQPPPPPR